MSEAINAWHFTGDKLRDGRPIPPIGTKLVHDGGLIMDKSGFHASIDPFDALMYAPGTILHRVQCGGEVIHGDDKLVCRERTILSSRDMAKELRLFACHCVRHTPLGDGRTVWDLLTDERSRNAVEASERFAHGRATEKELGAARADACDAAEAASRADARDDTWSAAWVAAGVAACDAARAASCNDADAATRATAWNAAEAAARVAEWNAAWDDARVAPRATARKWQRTEFNKVVATAFNAEPKGD